MPGRQDAPVGPIRYLLYGVGAIVAAVLVLSGLLLVALAVVAFLVVSIVIIVPLALLRRRLRVVRAHGQRPAFQCDPNVIDVVPERGSGKDRFEP